MRIKPLALAIITLSSLTSCGDESSKGSTLPSNDQKVDSSTLPYLACIDQNKNWVCDDADPSLYVSGPGDVGLTPENGHYLLLERRNNETNQRESVLASRTHIVNAKTTLELMLGLMPGNNSVGDAPQYIESTFLETTAILQNTFEKAMQRGILPLQALHSVSKAAVEQNTPSPVLAEPIASISNEENLSQWYSNESEDSRRQLAVQGDVALNNSDSNRLYLFQGNAEIVTGEGNSAYQTPAIGNTEIDLIPLDVATLAATSRLQRRALRLVKSASNLLIDTVSAATQINGEASAGSPIVLAPGQGIVSAEIVNEGREALIIMNMLQGDYTGENCTQGPAVSEGIFRISLEGNNSYRLLEQVKSCIHSGFSLLAANNTGNQYAAWDANEDRLWLFNNDDVAQVLDLQLPEGRPVQSIVMTDGGRYLAAIAYGQAIIVDVQSGAILHKITGAWGNVVDASFAGGGRTLTIASEDSVYALQLDDNLYLRQKSIFKTTETLRSLAASPDGDSYFAASDNGIHWLNSTGEEIAHYQLPAGLHIQQSAVIHNQLLLLSRGRQDLQFKLQRFTLSTPRLVAENNAL